jgi:DNA helicase-2/ATP-dependent DNA helicase PcrA
MTETGMKMNPAEEASARALEALYGCLDRGESFRLEAGAGAGKTYSLVKALQFLIKRNQYRLPRQHQKIACITFTNVAKDEIEARTDRSPLIYSDTIHGFCWSLINGFQRQIRDRLAQLPQWQERIEESGGLDDRFIEYTLGHRSIRDVHVSIHHDDVLELTVSLMECSKFRQVLRSKYPIILIDEYQDANAAWIESIKEHFLGKSESPQFGFFGDHWQKIYGDGCGKIEHPSLIVIGNEANFRSVLTVVECLNRMRPELPQFVVDPEEQGSIRIFHTNDWNGARRTGQHWGGDLPADIADTALHTVIDLLQQDGWDISPDATKILMLTHRILASKQGYSSLPSIFAFNESFTKKEHPHITFFADTLEPACEAYLDHRYGEMFLALGGSIPPIRSLADKQQWSDSMERLIELRKNGTVGDVIDHLRQSRRPRLPDTVELSERDLAQFDTAASEEMPRALKELQDLRTVAYSEIITLTRYLAGHSPFETKHGVKGAEFENVIVVIGRGWNQYNFNEMLELEQDVAHISPAREQAFERNRNLFYVVCSRPKRRLAILFTQQLSGVAMQTITKWFGNDSIRALEFH